MNKNYRFFPFGKNKTTRNYYRFKVRFGIFNYRGLKGKIDDIRRKGRCGYYMRPVEQFMDNTSQFMSKNHRGTFRKTYFRFYIDKRGAPDDVFKQLDFPHSKYYNMKYNYFSLGMIDNMLGSSISQMNENCEFEVIKTITEEDVEEMKNKDGLNTG